LLKLLLLKVLKTVGLRYGVFFSQHRWYWIRRYKILFFRRGRQFFRASRRFWRQYATPHRLLILIAFFPFGLIFFMLGLSFQITRKTMVQKTQETAIFKMASTASRSSLNIRERIKRVDTWVLERISQMKSNYKPQPTDDPTIEN
ncbi:MAG: hypothetical protein AAF402_04580, partial [Pseudomonadota bacterium]